MWTATAASFWRNTTSGPRAMCKDCAKNWGWSDFFESAAVGGACGSTWNLPSRHSPLYACAQSGFAENRGVCLMLCPAAAGNICAGGEIGRRAGFRFRCLRAWGFKSPLAHGTAGPVSKKRILGTGLCAGVFCACHGERKLFCVFCKIIRKINLSGACLPDRMETETANSRHWAENK